MTEQERRADPMEGAAIGQRKAWVEPDVETTPMSEAEVTLTGPGTPDLGIYS